jgi:streptogramin lyase
MEPPRVPRASRIPIAIPSLLAAGSAAVLAAGSAAGDSGRFLGSVRDAATGEPVAGAMVTFQTGSPAQAVTVYSDGEGRFSSPDLGAGPALSVRVRRIGWKDLRREETLQAGATPLELRVERESDPEALAAQLPANRWYQLVLERLADASQREELKRQCTYCHQQGNAPTRRVRGEQEWRQVVARMGRMGGMLSRDLREKLPALFNAAYDPKTAVPELLARIGEPGFADPPPPEARRALIEEWELGGADSMQHDVVVHPDGRLYSVDMSQDKLYRLDPRAADGARRSWDIPQGDLPLGGVFASAGPPPVATSNARAGPHSIQVAPDGALWITLALGNRLARFDPAAESFEVHGLEHGFYPHTLRFDARGRIWFTIAASNHLGFFDPGSGERRELRLPARTFVQAVTLRLMPALLWLGRHVDLRGRAAQGDGIRMPVPYGIDVAPDGGIWFSQLNEQRIGRVDPETFEVEMIETPFPAPRRLRFDSRGRLWIPSFSGGLLARFDPATREFQTFEIPIAPRGSETPYALHVDRRTDTVWICGANSDSLIRFEPAQERFTVYPLPTRVTYTREIDFDAEGRVWTSNSNAPTWQIEGGVPRVLRLDPAGAPAPAPPMASGG